MTNRTPVALGAALALPLLGYASIGSFARYTADDYCWAGVLRTEGFLRAQLLWYTGYSPRYAFTFLVNLIELAGPAIVPALPAAAIVVWVTTLTWALLQFHIRLGRLSTTTSALLLAEATALGSLQTAPDMAQSLYWQTGMLTYLLPLVLGTFLIGWMRRAIDRSPKLWALGITGLVTFVAGGLSEAYLIPQNVALTLALLVSVAFAPRTWPAERGASVHLAAALAGGVLALVAVLVAPSTASRVGGSPADIWLASSAAIATGAYQALRLVRFFPFTVLLCIGLPAVLGAGPARIDRRWFVLVSAVVAITLPFCYFPSFYAQNGNPPARSLIVPGTILISYLVFVGYTFQGRLKELMPAEPARVAVAVVLAILQVGIAVTSLPEQALAAQQAAARWDAEDQQIRASRDAGQADVTVSPLPPYLGEHFVTSDRQNWFNICVARYYGVRSIAASTTTSVDNDGA